MTKGIEKTSIHIFLDVDVVNWFQAQYDDWEDRMNTVLRAYMESQKDKS